MGRTDKKVSKQNNKIIKALEKLERHQRNPKTRMSGKTCQKMKPIK